MRRAWLLGSVATSALAIGVACGASSSSDGASGDVDAAADSGSPGDDDAGRADGSIADGSSDSSAGPFCASLDPQPTLCSDFDEGTTPAGADTQVDPGASVAIDPALGLSPPASYEAIVPSGVSQVTNALLRVPITFSASATKVVVSFAYQPSAPAPASGTLVIARVFIGHAHAVSIEPTSENGSVIREQEDPPGGLDKPSTTIPIAAAGSWTRYVLTIDLAGKSASLTADGAALVTLALTGTEYDLFALNLGLQSDSAFTAHYDDVVVNLE